MKTTLLACLGVFLAGPLAAQEAMQNSDFSDGTTHWHGDCKPAGTDQAQDFTSSTQLPSTGLQVDLHPSTWTKVTQVIFDAGKAYQPGMVLTISYQVSSDFKLSDRPSDYGDIGSKIGFGSADIKARAGEILAFVDVPPDERASQSGSTIYVYYDKLAQAAFNPVTEGLQTFTAKISPPQGTTDIHQTFCIAVPPGSGSITFTKISLAPGDASSPGAGSSQ